MRAWNAKMPPDHTIALLHRLHIRRFKLSSSGGLPLGSCAELDALARTGRGTAIIALRGSHRSQVSLRPGTRPCRPRQPPFLPRRVTAAGRTLDLAIRPGPPIRTNRPCRGRPTSLSTWRRRRHSLAQSPGGSRSARGPINAGSLGPPTGGGLKLCGSPVGSWGHGPAASALDIAHKPDESCECGHSSVYMVRASGFVISITTRARWTWEAMTRTAAADEARIEGWPAQHARHWTHTHTHT